MRPDAMNDDERAFLDRQGILPAQVVDVRGVPKKQHRRLAKASNAILLLGSHCKSGHHRLRTRAGHCVQCDPSKIAFESRHRLAGYIYIAQSVAGDLIKIGGTPCIDSREQTLRHQHYAGCDDWVILAQARVEEYGKLEKSIHARLRKYAVNLSYLKDNRLQMASEVFRCSFDVAWRATQEIVDA